MEKVVRRYSIVRDGSRVAAHQGSAVGLKLGYLASYPLVVRHDFAVYDCSWVAARRDSAAGLNLHCLRRHSPGQSAVGMVDNCNASSEDKLEKVSCDLD